MSDAWGGSWGTAWATSWSPTEPAPPDVFGGPGWVLHDESHTKKRRYRESRRELIETLLLRAYGRDLPQPVVAEVKQIAAPFVQAAGQTIQVDWKALHQAEKALRQLVALAEMAARESLDDDENFLLIS